MYWRHEMDPSICAKLYHSWKSSRDALAQSIQTYLDACEALNSVSFEAVTRSASTWDSSLPDALSTIDVELAGLVNEEERLRKARLSLLVSRNSARNFSNINGLPTEIISSIFLAAKPNPTADGIVIHPRFPTAISGVCQRWRQIALNIPSIWSYIRYTIDGPLQVNSAKCADLWSKRAGDSPRHVEMYQMDPRVNLDTTIHALRLSLEVQATHVERLHLSCSRRFMQSALGCLISNGASSIKVLQLKVEDRYNYSGHIMWWDEDVRYNALSNDRIEEFLSSVQFLDLRNTYFAWHSTAYHGLLELSLYLDFQIDFHLFPTQLEVKNILLSSPRLHTVFLKLTTSLRHQDHSVEPIRLNNLRNLTLLCYEESGCLGLLPLIGPGPNGLDVTLSVHYDPTIATEQCSFFDRSALKTLRVRPIDADFWLGLISAKLPHLESLVLDSCHFGDGDLRDFLHLLSTSDSHVSPWPKLRTLELEECRIDGDLLEQFLSIHSIRTIRLYGGRIVDPISGRRVALSDAMYEFEQRFSSIVQEIKYLPRRPLS